MATTFELAGLPNVACRTPESRMVMVVLNDGDRAMRFHVRHQGAHATLELGAGDVATLRWNAATTMAASA